MGDLATCACSHDYDEHDASEGLVCTVKDCPCVRYEADGSAP